MIYLLEGMTFERQKNDKSLNETINYCDAYARVLVSVILHGAHWFERRKSVDTLIGYKCLWKEEKNHKWTKSVEDAIIRDESHHKRNRDSATETVSATAYRQCHAECIDGQCELKEKGFSLSHRSFDRSGYTASMHITNWNVSKECSHRKVGTMKFI